METKDRHMKATRNTRQRTAIRDVFEYFDRPLSPDDVLAAARARVQGLGIATVYRNIRTLVDEGWLVLVELPGQAARYELAGKGHHHHFQCTGCGQLYELQGCVEHFRNMIPAGFQVTAHDLQLYGVCRNCRVDSRESAAKPR
jgi:Fur family ferric uptake transcriptional regulator